MLLKTISLKIALPALVIFTAAAGTLPRAIDQIHADSCSSYYYPASGYPTCVTSGYATAQYSSSYSPSGRLYQSGQITPNTDISSPCLYTSYVQWQTANIQYAEVTVNDPDSGQEKIFASGPYGSAPASWLQAGKTYVFNLVDLDNGRQVRLDSMQINLQNMTCTPASTTTGYGGGTVYYTNPPTATYQPSTSYYTTSSGQPYNPSMNSGILFNDWVRQNSQTPPSSQIYNGYTAAPAVPTYNGSGYNPSMNSGILFNDWVRSNLPSPAGSGYAASNSTGNNSGILYYNNSIPTNYYTGY